MNASIATDLGKSTSRIKPYWRALRRRALRELNINDEFFPLPIKSAIWSKLVYSPEEGLVLSDVFDQLSDEKRQLGEIDIVCPAQLQMELNLSSHEQFEYAHCCDISDDVRRKLADADALIKETWPEAHQEMRELLHAVIWIRSPQGLLSTSDPKKFGLLHVNSQYYNDVSVYELATALIHESAHHALFIESTLDPLIAVGFQKMMYSPLRDEMRPAIGVMHSLFASVRILQWAARLSRRPDHPAITNELHRIGGLYSKSLTETVQLLRACDLTKQGIKIVAEAGTLEESLPGYAHG